MLFPSRVKPNDVRSNRAKLIERYPDKEIVTLFDDYTHVPEIPGINCSTESVDVLESYDFSKTVFHYTCDSDELGLPFIERITERSGLYVPSYKTTPALYVNVNNHARTMLEAEYNRQRAKGFAKWNSGPFDFINIIQAIDIVAKIPGAFVEVGCYNGSSSCIAARYMNEKKIKRDCYFLDVFGGFDYEVAKNSSDTHWFGTLKSHGIEKVAERIGQYEDVTSGPSIHVLKRDIVSQELPDEIGPIAVANIDVDLYEAVAAALRKVAPKIVPGGIMIVEDPGHTPRLVGARLALQQFTSSTLGAKFVSIYMQSGQTFLIRK